MTFLNTRYRLTRSLTTEELEGLGKLSTLYGILGLNFEGEDLLVEYDASRIHEAEVLAAVRRAVSTIRASSRILPGRPRA